MIVKTKTVSLDWVRQIKFGNNLQANEGFRELRFRVLGKKLLRAKELFEQLIQLNQNNGELDQRRAVDVCKKIEHLVRGEINPDTYSKIKHNNSILNELYRIYNITNTVKHAVLNVLNRISKNSI